MNGSAAMWRRTGTAGALVVLALGVGWLGRSSGTIRVSPRAQERACGRLTPDDIEEESVATLPAIHVSRQPARVPQPSSREPAISLLQQELERAHWVEGRVVFPGPVPPDEECFVVAHGRDFSDGSDHRARVGPDGAFRLAFPAEASAGWIALEAGYHYLPQRWRWRTSGSGIATLQPRLGARVAGRVAPPGGATLRGEPLEIELLEQGGLAARHAKVDPEGRFVFAGVRIHRDVTLSYRGAALLGACGPIALEAGVSYDLEVPLVRGVVVAGIVREEGGRRLAGIEVESAGRSARTRADGSFRLPALESGPITLDVQEEGYLSLRVGLGTLAAGTRRERLVLVLARGKSARGRVLWPDGSPAEVLVRLVPEAHGGLRRIQTARSAADGTFLVRGLAAGTYTLLASGVRRGLAGERSNGSARIEHVEAGTTGLEVSLSPSLPGASATCGGSGSTPPPRPRGTRSSCTRARASPLGSAQSDG